jgi:hypothetical protein
MFILTAFDSILLNIQPFQIYLDTAFCADIYSLFQTILPSNPNSAITLPKPSENRIVSATPLTIQRFQHEAISGDVFILTKTGRSTSYRIPFSIMAVLNLGPVGTSLQISLPPNTITGLDMTVIALSKVIREKVSLSWLLHAFRTGRTLDTKGRAASIVIRPLETVLRFGQYVTGVMQFMNEDDPSGIHGLQQTPGQIVTGGFVAAGRDMLGAVTGLVMDPIREAQKPRYKHKAVGALAGFGKGIVDVIVKPFQSVFEAGAGIAIGIRKAIDGGEVPTRQREQRVLPRGQIVPYDHGLALLQLTCNSTHKGEVIEVFYCREDFVVLTQKYVWVVANDGRQVKDCISVADVLSTTNDRANLIMKRADGSSFDLDCRIIEHANDLAMRLRSKIFLEKLMQE